MTQKQSDFYRGVDNGYAAGYAAGKADGLRAGVLAMVTGLRTSALKFAEEPTNETMKVIAYTLREFADGAEKMVTTDAPVMQDDKERAH